MAERIFLIDNDGELQPMDEAPFDSERVFQTLLERHPDLLTADGEPRRWLLVDRETAVADQSGGTGRWSVDHLFLDADATPTLVEVKRHTDTRLRREVLGQMLDYAAR